MTRPLPSSVFVVMLDTITRIGVACLVVGSPVLKKSLFGVNVTSPESGLIVYRPSLVFSSLVT